MAPMRRHDLISCRQCRANADSDRLLPDRQVDRTAHFFLLITRSNLFLDHANAKHVTKHGETHVYRRFSDEWRLVHEVDSVECSQYTGLRPFESHPMLMSSTA